MRPMASNDSAGRPTEWVDVVDDDDRVIGTVSRAEMRSQRVQHRAVFIAVLSSSDLGAGRRLLVHRRAAHKDVWPDRWDLAVGGVVSAGETYERAAPRELAEEVGVHEVTLVPIGGGRYADDDVVLVGRCYLVLHDGPFHFDDGEVVEARWVTGTELDEMLSRPASTPFVPDSVALVLPLVRSLLD